KKARENELSLRDALAAALARATEVERELLDPKTVRDARLMASLGREHQRLTGVVALAKRWEKPDEGLAQGRELVVVDDAELAAEARAEVERVELAKAQAERDLKPLLM